MLRCLRRGRPGCRRHRAGGLEGARRTLYLELDFGQLRLGLDQLVGLVLHGATSADILDMNNKDKLVATVKR